MVAFRTWEQIDTENLEKPYCPMPIGKIQNQKALKVRMKQCYKAQPYILRL